MYDDLSEGGVDATPPSNRSSPTAEAIERCTSVNRDKAIAQILLSGSGDFVSLAEAAQYVRDDLPDASANEVRSATLGAISDLLAQGYVRAGELTDRFVAWTSASALPEIEARWTDPDAKLAPWDGVWLANTPAGDRVADEMAGDGRVTTRPDSANDE